MERILDVKFGNKYELEEVKDYLDKDPFVREKLLMRSFYGEFIQDVIKRENISLANYVTVDLTHTTHRILDYFLENGKLKMKIDLMDDRFKDDKLILVPRGLKYIANKKFFISTFDIDIEK